MDVKGMIAGQIASASDETINESGSRARKDWEPAQRGGMFSVPPEALQDFLYVSVPF